MDHNSKFDLVALSKDLGIEIDDMVDIFNVYFIEVNDLILNLRYLEEKKDWVKFGKLLHNLKGTSINLNIVDMYETAVTLDNLIETKKYEEIAAYITKLKDISTKAKLEINNFFHT